MRVLIISHNPVGRTSNMGKTILSYFKNFNVDEVAQFYIRPEVPSDGSVCQNYFRFTDKDAVMSIFSFRERGAVYGQKDIQPVKHSVGTGALEPVYQFGRRRTAGIYFLRNLLWKLSRWETGKLWKWVDDFNPDVIFFASGDYGFMYDIARKIAEHTGKPLAVACVDDYYIHNRNGGHLFGRMVHKAFLRTVNKTMARASMIFTICESMAREYEAMFGKPCHVLHTTAQKQEMLLGDIVNRRVLIVGTVPYNKATTARAFEAYFHGWDRACLAQVFSNSKKPVKGHCAKLFQITDKRMLQRWFDPHVQVGQTFAFEDLEDAWTDIDPEVGQGVYKKLYMAGKKKNSFTHLARGVLWQKKFWCNDEFNRWLDEFQPECVFLSFSNDYFIPQIAFYVAEKFDIPIVSSIGDDYYFNYGFSLSPLYHLYKLSYRKLIRKVFAHGGSAIYISDKIRDKYNFEFGLNGETVYLTSELERRPFRAINQKNPVISYFGNIGVGRNESLDEIGKALGKISPDYKLRIYSGQQDSEKISIFEGNANIEFCGSIPYAQVIEKTHESDILVIVEGFKPADVDATRYSLSTKAADSLASGAQILVYGSPECGVIEYMQSTNAAAVCTRPEKLEQCIRALLQDEKRQKQYYDNAIEITNKHHNLESSTAVFRSVVEKVIKNYDATNRI